MSAYVEQDLLSRNAALEAQLAAKTRELEIEAALEKVRSRSLAMHKSDELQEVANTLFETLQKLNIQVDSANIAIFKEGTRDYEYWVASDFQKRAVSFRIPYTDLLLTKDLIAARESGTDFSAKAYSFEEKNEWFNYAFKNTDFKLLSEERKQFILNAKGIVVSIAFAKNTGVQITSYSGNLLSEDEIDVLKRFSRVFEQAYIRFLDLQKAEVQAREAQIEVALERVRARTMGMHQSKELHDVIREVYNQLRLLQFRFDGVDFMTDYTEKGFYLWLAAQEYSFGEPIYVPAFDHKIFRLLKEVHAQGKDFFTFQLIHQEKDEYFEHLFTNTILKNLPEELKQQTFNAKGMATSCVVLKNIILSATNLDSIPYTEEENAILKRFAFVFEQAYTRFIDLKKVETQAREATIEAALERVRGKAMAMHSSKDLADTIAVFYHEVAGLSLTPRRCGIGLIDKETHISELSTMNTTEEGQTFELIGHIDLRTHPVLESIYNNWLTKTEYHPMLRGNEIKEYYQVIRPQMAFPDYSNDAVQYGYFFFFEEGGVYAWTEKELDEPELKIYRRFTSVLSLTYKRYKDLKDAEARTQAAIKDAALDRIRADIASMRTINDLDRITPLIWNELTVLGISFIRCGVFIMDDSQELIHTFLSTPDGKAIAAFHLPYDTPGNIGQILSHWQDKKNYIDHWDEEAFTEFAGTLAKQGTLASSELYLKTIPQGGFYLHFLPFLQGMLYVGNSTQLTEEELKLIQSVADAFSTAYARYEDFNKLEAAKQQVENTLTDLEQAQTQLIQSEKMASLGELTAGIAHEIQNPLNFVNNFSEINNELIEEMNEELNKGNVAEAILIAKDVKNNQEKIYQHGKRADAIVKGMLQHSRSSTNAKEPTDINALANEYLRLAYHGLRAKDNSFNASMKTDFDETIGNINIIPQDIGRVILNLITNAFYAVAEKKKQQPDNYEPIVTVSTKSLGTSSGDEGKIEIRVSDNGNGIPQKILDKIFQPFFTTKPAGEGTGLGLSLSYDIVKAHGGELKVKTKEEEGSEFIIQLPIN
jgi:signal transduction histidine kinase